MIKISNFRKFAATSSKVYDYAQSLNDLRKFEGWGVKNNDLIYMDSADLADKGIPTLPGGVKLYPEVQEYLRKKLKYTGDLKVGAYIPRNISSQLQDWYFKNNVSVRKLKGFNKLPISAQNRLATLGFNANLANWPKFRESLAKGDYAGIIRNLRDSAVWRREQEWMKTKKNPTLRWTTTINALERDLGLTPSNNSTSSAVPTNTTIPSTSRNRKPLIQLEQPPSAPQINLDREFDVNNPIVTPDNGFTPITIPNDKGQLKERNPWANMRKNNIRR